MTKWHAYVVYMTKHMNMVGAPFVVVAGPPPLGSPLKQALQYLQTQSLKRLGYTVLFPELSNLVLTAIVNIKEMPPLPFTVVYGTHEKCCLIILPQSKNKTIVIYS